MCEGDEGPEVTEAYGCGWPPDSARPGGQRQLPGEAAGTQGTAPQPSVG